MTTTKTPQNEIDPAILSKHALGITAARNYYVLNIPTGMSDHDYDVLEKAALEDGLSLRDYVRKEIQGTRTENADYITKVEKEQVSSDMYDALIGFISQHPEVSYIIPKYDGSSLAGYYDVNTGECMRVVTVGGSNLGGEGIDQTYKFSKFFPNLKGTGICALQCECLVSLEHGFAESSRQKANGLVNSKYLENEVSRYVNIRCFRYFLDPSLKPVDYKMVLDKMPKTKNVSGDIKFSGGFVISVDDLKRDYETIQQYRDLINHDIWVTPTGTFLVDGVVCYTKHGVCVKALKYKDAGRGETAEVLGIKWNNQIFKGKDSWSANASITEVVVRGSKITKPSVGSVKKMITSGLSKGARVTVILANSTIPQVKDVIQPGNLDYEWPTCSCGYQMSSKDIFGALLKCGNPDCSERYERMKAYLAECQTIDDMDLNRLLIIDRFDWNKKADKYVLYPEIVKVIKRNLGADILRDLLAVYLTTDLQRKTLDLVVTPAYKALKDYLG